MKPAITTRRLSLGGRATLTLLALACAGMAHAQPAKTLRIIVPYGPGGTGDVIARLVAQESGKSQLIVLLEKAKCEGTW